MNFNNTLTESYISKMKTITILLIFITITVISGCKKDLATCATCTETQSGYNAKEYCSDPASVDLYIKELKEQGAAQGQNWICNKH